MNNLINALDECETLSFDEERVIIEGFMERYSVEYEEAKDIFEETKKWLWLASQNSDNNDVKLYIDRHLLVIDEMWHTFILHTKQYYRFCMQHFNKLIHHSPTPKKVKERQQVFFRQNPEKAIEEHELQARNQYNVIYEYLGPETLTKWYDSMASKYTPEYLKSIKKT